jgi:hypothetical protein
MRCRSKATNARDRQQEFVMSDENANQEPMPAKATANLFLWASGFGLGALVVLLGGAVLVGIGVLGHDPSQSRTPASQSAANAPTQPGPTPAPSAAPAGAAAPQTTGQAPAPPGAPAQPGTPQQGER